MNYNTSLYKSLVASLLSRHWKVSELMKGRSGRMMKRRKQQGMRRQISRLVCTNMPGRADVEILHCPGTYLGR